MKKAHAGENWSFSPEEKRRRSMRNNGAPLRPRDTGDRGLPLRVAYKWEEKLHRARGPNPGARHACVLGHGGFCVEAGTKTKERPESGCPTSSSSSRKQCVRVWIAGPPQWPPVAHCSRTRERERESSGGCCRCGARWLQMIQDGHDRSACPSPHGWPGPLGS